MKKVAVEEGDWNKLLPYLFFACSPFELLYGREVCGLLDVL